MNPITQPGIHPDAESLNAFAEQSLPAVERQQVLTHLASCSRCREVVFLAQDATSAESNAETARAASEKNRPWQAWLAGWRWTWIPATALAGLVGVAVVSHFQQVPAGPEIARNPSQAQAMSDMSEATGPPASKPLSHAMTGLEAMSLPTVRSKEAPATSKSAKGSGDLAALRKKAESNEALESVAVAQLTPLDARSNRDAVNLAQKPQAIGGSNASVGGPRAANDVLQQQMAGQQDEAAKDQLHSARYAAKAATVAGIAPAAANPAPMAPAPAPARELALQSASNPSFAIANDDGALDRKKKVIVLPNGASALSVVTANGRTVAIDPSGTVFLSEAPGEKWTTVATQWTGRAILVRLHQAQPQARTTSQSPVFELVNEKIETWVSSDGKTWVAQPSSLQ
jgi:hypothetical protein